MKTIPFHSLTIPVSRLILGTALPALMAGGEADEVLDAALAAGITTFDTARSYRGAEKAFGAWVARRGVRNRINIQTKGCNPDQTGLKFTPDSLRGELETSLSMLGTDHVELYALHRDDPSVPAGVFIETLNTFKQEGKILHFGASNWTWQRMAEANDYAAAHGLEGFTFGSPAFSLAVVVGDPWGGSVHLSGAENADARAWFLQSALPVFPYSGLARGFFSGKYRTDRDASPLDVLRPETCAEYDCPDNRERLRRAEAMAAERGCTVGQICLAWILAQPITFCPIIGPSNPQHLAENLRGLELELSDKDCRWLNLEA